MTSRDPRGFALVLTLALVLIAAAALAAVVRGSLVANVETLDATQELQRRWATASLRATLLPRADRLLTRAHRDAVEAGELDETARPEPELRIEVRLAGQDYLLVLSDEQAKLNPAALAGLTDVEQARDQAERLAAAHAVGDESPLRVRGDLAVLEPPAEEDQAAPGAAGPAAAPESGPTGPLVPGLEEGQEEQEESEAPPPPLVRGAGYGRVFVDPRPERLIGPEGRGVASVITCWGDGRVNLRRAPREVIEAAGAGGVLRAEIEALVAARDEDPGRSFEQLLQSLGGLDVDRQAMLAARFTDESTSHGLWVIATGPTRSWYGLSVAAWVTDLQENEGGEAERVRRNERYDYVW